MKCQIVIINKIITISGLASIPFSFPQWNPSECSIFQCCWSRLVSEYFWEVLLVRGSHHWCRESSISSMLMFSVIWSWTYPPRLPRQTYRTWLKQDWRREAKEIMCQPEVPILHTLCIICVVMDVRNSHLQLHYFKSIISFHIKSCNSCTHEP